MADDVFAPRSSADDARTGPLHTVTFVTADPASAERFFATGLGLEASEAVTLDNGQCRYLGVAAGTRAQRFWLPSAGRESQIRALYVDTDTPQIRAGIDGRYVGGLSIGFPMTDLSARETIVNEAGFESVVGVKQIEFTSPDGVTYVSEEIHFIAPENTYVLGVKRPAGFRTVGPLDAAKGIGAPAYSAQCLADADAAIPFYRDVLGYEIRRDVDLTVAEPSGLNLAAGMKERFIQAFAPGATTGYLVFLDHYQANLAPPVHYIGPPARGVAMWSFPGRDLDDLVRRARDFGAAILREPDNYSSPFIDGLSAMIEAPGGYPVEVFEA